MATKPSHASDPEVTTSEPLAPAPRITVEPQTGEQTRVLLTGDDRTVVTEDYVLTAEYGFRIFVRGQHFEQIGVAADSGTTIFAPTR
jgi:hypothetical protein